ncbi:MAG: FtsQ-type POTRA domain-containing protein [Deltaproteobacteria bacterium]|nr:FtsQ-type POTRA domain-containing protein [Deltaproteobacteria bacterium]
MAFISIITIFVSGRIFYQELLNAPFLQIKEININDVKRVSKDEVLELAEIGLGDNIIAVDIAEIKKRIKKHPWVETVKVNRKMPDKLLIDIKERTAAALINLDSLYLIDNSGSIFKRASIEDDVDLPVITTDVAKEEIEDDERASSLIIEAIDLIGLLNGREKFGLDMVSEIKIDTVYGLTLYAMDSGTRIEIGSNNLQEKLLMFDRVFQEFGSSFSGIESVDLNYGKKVVVRLRDAKDGIKIKKGGDDKWGKRTI